jgi:hypothetical protein
VLWPTEVGIVDLEVKLVEILIKSLLVCFWVLIKV